MLEILTLGGLVIRCDGQSVTGIVPRKVQAPASTMNPECLKINASRSRRSTWGSSTRIRCITHSSGRRFSHPAARGAVATRWRVVTTKARNDALEVPKGA